MASSELTGGLRYFEDTSETITLLVPGGFLPANTASSDFDALTPRLVATWLPSPDLTVYASYSEGFRSGLNQTPLTLLAAPLPPAEADRLHNYEVGARGRLFNGFATYDAALYYIKWDDIHLAGSLLYGTPPVYISATINGESASGFGADLSLTLHPSDGLDIGGSFSYNDLAQDADVFQNGILVYSAGDRLSFSPAVTASVFLNYDFALTSELDGRFNINANYTSEQILNVLPNGAQTSLCDVVGVAPNQIATCFSDEPVFVNASFDISSHSGHTLTIFATNLTDEDGVAAPDYSPTTAFRPRPTTIGLQLELRY
ncbi:MAG: TonB-dependent receptor [Caulobacteraceae bacterium]|nr:TonB-dependent receptor [Caulobacteraceae bacterium]